MAYQNNNNRQVPDSVRNVNLQPQAAPVDKLIQYQADKGEAAKSKALMDGLAKLGQGLVDIEPVWQRQADEAVIKAAYEDGANRKDWNSVSRNVKGMAQFNPYIKDAYRRMQAADIVRTGALELGSLPSKEQLTPDKYEQVVKDTQDKMLEAFKESGLRPKDYGSHLLAFDEYRKKTDAEYFKKHTEYEYKLYLTKSSTECADGIYSAVQVAPNKTEGYTVALQSFINQKIDEGVPDADLAATVYAGVQGYVTRFPENVDTAQLTAVMKNMTVNGKSMRELIPNFDANLAETIRTAKRNSYNDRKLEYDNEQLTQTINKENGVKDFFNWFFQNQTATDEQIMEYMNKVIQDNNIEGSGGLDFLSNVSKIKGYLKSLKEVTTDPDIAQEFMAQAAAGELDYTALSQAITDKKINYKEVPQFMNRDKSVKDQVTGKFNQEVKEFSKNYLTKGGGNYSNMDSKTRKAATTTVASIQDKVTTGEMTPEEGQAALRKLKNEAIPNMILNNQIRNKNAAILANGRFRRATAIPTGDSNKALAAIRNMGIVRNTQGVRNQSITLADIPTNDRNKDGITGDNHYGFDIGGVYLGQPIYAPTDGQVVSSGYESTMGNYAIVKTKQGYMLAMHLQEPVANGLKVKRNESFGRVGNTGRTQTNNCCLHVEFWDKDLNLIFPEK